MVDRLGTGGVAGNAGFSITMLPNAAHLAGNITRFAGDIRSVEEPLKKARDEVLIPRIRDNFADETAAGTPWRDWSENTPFMPYHTSFGPANSILDVTGTLFREATSPGIWTIRNQEGEAYVSGSSFQRAPYARFMQEGAPNNTSPHGNPAPIPPRPFIIINDKDLDDIDTIFKDWLEDRFTKRVAGGMVGGLAGGI